MEPPPATWAAQTSLDELLASAPLSDDAANAAVWVLVRNGQPALAWHLASSLETRDALAMGIFTARSLSALALAPLINAGNDAVVEPLREALSDLLLADLDRREVRQRRANGLLVLAMTLRPALIAPYLTSARGILENQYQQIEREALREVATAVIDAGRLRTTLSEAAFKGESSSAARERERFQLREQTEAYLREAQHKTIKYAAATRVWKQWLDENGELAALLRLVIDNDIGQLDLARILAADWRDRAKVLTRVRTTDEECRKGGARLRPIEGAAREGLVQAALEAVGYVETWCRLNEPGPDDSDGQGPTHLAEWARRTGSLIDKAIEELTPVGGNDLPDQAALDCVVAALRDLAELIDPDTPPRPRLPWQQSLGRSLVTIPDLALDANWRPDAGNGNRAYEAALITQGAHPRTLTDAFERADASCRHETTGRIILLGRHSSEPLVEEWAQRRERGLARCEQRLRARLREVEGSIAHALDFGFLDETNRSAFAEQLEALVAPHSADFGLALQQLDEVDAKLAEHKRYRVDAERERLAGHEDLKRNQDLRARVNALLEQGDIVTATEYVTHAENRTEPPRDHREPMHQRAFFPGFVTAATAGLGEQDTRALIDLCDRDAWPDALRPAPAQRDDALKLLRACGHAVRYAKSGDDVAAIGTLFSLIGFEAVKATSLPARRAASREVQIETQRIQDRDICAIPAFGSRALGRYRLVCLKPGTSWAEEIAGVLGGADPVLPGVPVLIFYPGRLNVAERRSLARKSREKAQTFLLIDEWLLLYLATCAPAERLKAFFECTLPFTALDPYSSTGGDVPDELFMGRRAAIARIVDRQGTNLVYGGRQLGKTALLKEVRRRHHKPDSGFHVVWIDLNEKEIGRGRPPAELWSVIATDLAKEIVKDQVQRAETVQRHIKDWLNADDRRRLLLLLDESDNFFAQDAENGYPVLHALKGLMDGTERRFKVVMAGLHNVQRASRDPNTPVAHLAQPLCVGPLIENGEAREAFRLVTMPLRTLGYVIDDDVVNRILAYANYAPNLIQDFCGKLLQYLNDADQANYDPEQTPPYQVTSEHVETAYQRRNLRDFIRDRFQITLALDPRYRLIALIIAQETLHRRDQAASSTGGFAVAWIRDQALGWWERGFPDRTAEAFRVLLDEMVGLGILRFADGNYALRSPNLVNLLGARSSIEQDLLDAATEEPPPPYTAAVHRRSWGVQQWMRSPLTAEQEHRLLQPSTGISLVFGLLLAGIKDIGLALREAAETLPGIEVRTAETASHLPVALRQARDRQAEDTHLIYLVTNAAAWSAATVDEARRVLANRRSKSRTVRVVFIGDARSAWKWQREARSVGAATPELVSLKPWASETLKVWLRDNRLGSIEAERLQTLTAATGLWHGPLHKDLAPLLQTPERWREIIDALEPAPPADRLPAEIGVPDEALAVLRTMAELQEPLSPEDLLGLVDAELGEIEDILAWGEVAGVIRAERKGKRRLDPYIAATLLAP